MAGSCTTNTHIDGLTTPAIGPTARAVVARLEATPAPTRTALLRPRGRRPALERGAAHQRPAQRAAGALPADRRARVQELPGLEPERLAAGTTSTSCRRRRASRSRRPPLAPATQRVGDDRGQVGLGASHWRAPVDARDVHGLACNGLCEQVDTDVDDAVARHEVPPQQRDRAAGRAARWTVDLGSGRDQRAPLAVAVLWIVGGADHRDDDRAARRLPIAARAGAAGSCSAPWPSTTSSRMTRGAGSARLGGAAPDAASGRSSGGPGPRCSASSPKSTNVAVRAEGLAAISTRPRRRGCRRRTVRAAGAASPGGATGAGHGGTSWPSRQHRLGGGGEVGPPGPEQREMTGVASRSVYAVIDAATSSAGGLETSTITRRRGRRRAVERSRVERPPTVGGQVAPADAERRGDADAGVVEQGEHLLGSRCPRPRRCRRVRARRRWRSPARPRRRPRCRSPAPSPAARAPRRALEGDLLLDRHVVAEDHHVAAGLEGVHRLHAALGPGTDTRRPHRGRAQCRTGGARGRHRVSPRLHRGPGVLRTQAPPRGSRAAATSWPSSPTRMATTRSSG